jgi:methylated-DNA-[protein]-cysteine S-methyltransferase
VFRQTKDWLDLYFSGRDPGFTPPLLPKATEFRRTVWTILRTVPYGRTVTYGEIAERIAREKCPPQASSRVDPRDLSRDYSRAVGGAVGHNPVSLIIPCHRVVGADGSLTGYAGGIERKIRLLELEGVEVVKKLRFE